MDIKTFCEQFYSSHYIPIAIYKGDEPILLINQLENKLNTFYSAASHLLADKRSPCVFSPNNSGYYGSVRVNGSDETLIIGPIFSGEITDEAVYAFMKENTISVSFKDEIAVFLSSLPKYTYNQFVSLLAFLHNCINGEAINVIEHFKLSDKSGGEQIAQAYTMKNLYAKEMQTNHGTYYFEMQMLSYVKAGDTQKLNALFGEVMKSQQVQEGVLAENPLRQAKNLLIGLVTMVGKVGAIGGGMDIEETYQLIDIYIRECEKAQSVELVKTLQYNLMLDFTERVALCKQPPNVSKEISDAMQFIKNHTNYQICIDDVAKHVCRSRAYITKKFHEETGYTINAYVLHCKLVDAKNLLRYSDNSISEISNFLCFSSQSYFQNVFKKEYGVTPANYRKQYNN